VSSDASHRPVSASPTSGTRRNFSRSSQVEKKFGDQNIRVLSETRGEFCITTPKNKKIESKSDRNTDTHSAKIRNFDFLKIWFRENPKLD